jgi:hypothetical protein
MKRISAKIASLIVLVGIVLAMAFVPNVIKTQVVEANWSTPTTVATDVHSDTMRPTNHGAFYHGGRQWIFYVDTGHDIVWKSSADGATWSAKTVAIAHASLSNLDFSLYYDGTHVHVAYGLNGQNLFYDMGTPASDGTITWVGEQDTGQANPFVPSITVTSDGYPVIAYSVFTDGSDGWVVMSTRTDGVWNTAAGFPYEYSTGFVVSVAACSLNTAGRFGIAWTDSVGVCSVFIKTWTGAAWQATNDATGATEGTTDFKGIDAIGKAGTDDLYVAWTVKTSFNMTWSYYTYATNTSANVGGWFAPFITKAGSTTLSSGIDGSLYGRMTSNNLGGEHLRGWYYQTSGSSLDTHNDTSTVEGCISCSSVCSSSSPLIFYWYSVAGTIRSSFIPHIPSATTDTPTIGSASAILRSTLTANGDLSEAVDYYRFEYGTTTAYGTNTAWETAALPVSGSYSLLVTGLIPSTTYHYRFVCRNGSASHSYAGYMAADYSFATLAAPHCPSTFSGLPLSASQGAFSWTPGAGATETMLRYSTGAYPATVADGTEAYYDAGSNTIVASLVSGQTYFFRAWGHSSLTFSVDYIDTILTTYAGGAGITPPSAPAPLTGPSILGLAGAPGYGVFLYMAQNSGMPTNNWFQLAYLVVLSAIVIGVAVTTKSTLATVIATVVCLAAGLGMGLIPLGIIMVIGCLGAIIAWMRGGQTSA